jgi:hypothetical protein
MRSPLSALPAVAIVVAPAIATAHITMLSPDRRTSEQKQAHCGFTGSTRANATTHPTGERLVITWDETIAHHGWYRISLHPDGDTFRIPPASDGPNGYGGASNFPTEDMTGMTDPGGSIILADRIPNPHPGGGVQSFEITLPDVPCDNCTLQLLQVMTDTPTYDPNSALYFQCADLVVSSTAPDAGPPPDASPADGAVGGPDAGTDAGPRDSGGCRTTGKSSGILTVVAVVWLRRRTSRTCVVRPS